MSALDWSTVPERMRQSLTVLAPLHVDIQDDSAAHHGHAGTQTGGHFRLTVVSPAFVGLGRVARHRLVLDALSDLMRQGIHALTIHPATPEEFSLPCGA